ncbi:MAG: 4Fe-4S binding protein [Phycisphaerales bacterium]|nr:MAG: 4Fe-4S binding protein [Phycisphaerales bacterium]
MADRSGKPRRLLKAFLLTLPVLVLMAMMATQGRPLPEDPIELIPIIVAFLFIVGLFFLIVYTGRTHRYRSILFVTYAVCFVISFISNLFEVRGSMALTEEEMIQGHTPFCHMVIPMTVIPAALSRTIIFPGSMLQGFAAIGPMLILWLGASITLGRGWCSWACFYGGLDEGFSKIGRKPIIKRIKKKWTYLPFAVLLAIMVSSAATLTPTYCAWLCPFKTVTEYAEVTSATTLLQAGIFLPLFFGLVIVMPILTKRRTQCGLFCPMGAFQSFTNKVNIFDVRVAADKCVQCGRCVETCPTFCIDAESIKKGRTRITCTKCGGCIDECPKDAISYHIKGTRVGVKPQTARMMFVYPAFLFLSIMGSGMMAGAAYRMLLLITTGNVIQ